MEKHNLTVTNQDGDTLSIELVRDVGPNEWMRAFRTILYWLTFDAQTINEYLGEEEL